VPTGGANEWVGYHYLYDAGNLTYVSYTYQLKQEIWPNASNPANATWAWDCISCGESSETSCDVTYPTSCFPLDIAQQNNGNDNTSPVNDSGDGWRNGSFISREKM